LQQTKSSISKIVNEIRFNTDKYLNVYANRGVNVGSKAAQESDNLDVSIHGSQVEWQLTWKRINK